MRDVVLYVIENADLYRNIKEDKHVRPEESKLAVPVTFTREGNVVISLKSKLGKTLGTGGFGTVKTAVVLFNLGELAKLTIAKGASKTMTPKDETGKKAVQVEKDMMLRLKQLGGNRSVLSCMSVTEYKEKDKILKEQKTGIELERDVGKLEEKPKREKIGIILEFCNGGDVEKFIEKRFPSFNDDEVELIAEDVLNGAVFLHDNSIFHSDLKPANIMLIVDAEGKVTGAKIADFGCARDLEDPKQRTYFTGDRSYHSPELRQKDLKMLERIDPELREETEKLSQATNAHAIALAKYQESKKIVKEKETAASQLTETAGAEETALVQKEHLEAKDAKSKAKEEATAAAEAYTNAYTAYSNKKESLIDKYRKELYPIDETILKSDIYAIGMIFEELFLGRKIIPEKKVALAKKLEEAEASLATAKASLEKAKANLQTAEKAEQEKLDDEIETLTTQIEGIEGNIDKIQKDTEKLDQNAAKIEERLSPEMKKLIADMKSDDPSGRLTVNDALHRFQELKRLGKIFISEQVQMADIPPAEETAAATEETAPQDQAIVTPDEEIAAPDFGKGKYNIPEKYLKKAGY